MSSSRAKVARQVAELRSAGQVRTSFDFAQDKLCPYVLSDDGDFPASFVVYLFLA
jgi:hypothetical protein